MGGSIYEGKDGGEEEGKDAGGRTREVLFAGDYKSGMGTVIRKASDLPFPNFIFVRFSVLGGPSRPCLGIFQYSVKDLSHSFSSPRCLCSSPGLGGMRGGCGWVGKGGKTYKD